MNVTEDDIRLIIRLFSEKLGSNPSPEKVRSLAAEAIAQLSMVTDEKPVAADNISKSGDTLIETKGSQKLIVDAFGMAQGGLGKSAVFSY